MKYVLITAAKNERKLIGGVLESVCSQSEKPLRWVIVDDGSTDGMHEVIAGYAAQHPWIDLVRREPGEGRSFAGKAHAVNGAVERLRDLDFDLVGNLDADVTFDRGYMEFLLGKFSDDAGLGVAGTPFTEQGGYDSTKDSFEGENFVAGPCQLFRRACWKEIGGYTPNAAGGVDWIAVMTAKMKGWKVRSFAEMRFHHHRPMGTAMKSPLAALFSYGRKDYYLGGSPLWQLFRVGYRMMKPPRIVGGLALLAGYAWAAARRTKRAVGPELMAFHRREQMAKLRAVFRALAGGRKVNAFSLVTDTRAAS